MLASTGERKKLLHSQYLHFYPLFHPLIPPPLPFLPLPKSRGHEKAPWGELALTQPRAPGKDLCSMTLPLPISLALVPCIYLRIGRTAEIYQTQGHGKGFLFRKGRILKSNNEKVCYTHIQIHTLPVATLLEHSVWIINCSIGKDFRGYY